MAEPRIEALVPAPSDLGGPLDVDALAALYDPPTAGRRADRVWLRTNFVASIDGAATGPDDRSGTLSTSADKLVFDVLRRLADVVVVGAGTVRIEGYDGPLVSDEQRAWRVAHGRTPDPAFVIVSEHLALEPASDVFRRSPVPVIIATVSDAPAERREALSEVATLVDCGAEELDVWRLRGALADRGLLDVLCEGGPTLHGSLVTAAAVDELCLTVTPKIEAGAAPRITNATRTSVDDGFRLAHVLRSASDDLHLRYVRE